VKHKSKSPDTGHSFAGRPIPLDNCGITETSPSLWGGDWLSRFAASFSGPLEEPAGADDAVTETVRRAIRQLPELEQRVVLDYYIFCYPRRVIARHCGLSAQDVDLHRAHAERRLRGILAGFVKQRFGVDPPEDSVCPYCRVAAREALARELSTRSRDEAWSTLRRRLNGQFGLDVRRVQPLITHCRFHEPTLQASHTKTEEESCLNKSSSKATM
jgi:hypothetical protein